MVAKINRLSMIKKMQKLLMAFGLVAVFAFKVDAAPSFLVDDESEALLYHIVRPIFKVAGVGYDKNKIHIINDMSLNAFVADGNNLFVHTGTLINAKNVNELSGILAHETGHIAGGHILRQKLKIADMQTLSAISLIAAGSAAVASGQADAAIAVALGTQNSLINSMMAYQLSQERAADESAVKYLKALHQSPVGLRDFMKTIQKNNRLSGYEQTPYFRTHPMSVERQAFFEKSAKENKGSTDSPYDQDFAFVQAKLTAFLLPENQVLRKYPDAQKTEAAKYAHAIVALRQKNFKEAEDLLDELIEASPNRPYFYQLKAEVLFESGKIEAAEKNYQKALQLKPDGDEIMLSYAACALENPNRKQNLGHIISVLNKAQISRETPIGWELLSKAYYEKGQKADSLYASAKYSYIIGNIEAAKLQIKEAQKLNPSESLRVKLRDLEYQIKN